MRSVSRSTSMASDVDAIESTANARSLAASEPDAVSKSSLVGVDMTTVATSCDVCHGLQEGRSIDCDFERLEATSDAGCASCKLLYTVVKPYKKYTGRCYIRGENESRDFILKISHLDNSQQNAPRSVIDIDVEIMSNENTSIPWTALIQYPSVFGVEDPAIAVRKIGQWLENCKTHQKCQTSTIDGPPYLPTRVLELRSPNHVRLHISDKGERGQYACLSHCWGGVVPLRTTSETFESFQHTGIPRHTLPRTFQNVIDLVFQLGLRYLWIDSLCIIQDNLSDWRHEGSRMSEIYSGAYITIAAANAPNSTTGLYSASSTFWSLRSHSYMLPDPTDGRPQHEVSVFRSTYRWDSKFNSHKLPLQERAWALQEEVLSPRTVHFADDMLYWACSSSHVDERGGRTGLTSDASSMQTLRQKVFTPRPTSMHQSVGGHHPNMLNLVDGNVYSVWHEIIHQYTSCNLTFRKDKFPALQGMARYVQRERKCAYFAGLWEDSIWLDILWHVDIPEPVKTSDYRAPSWSWASREGRIFYNFLWLIERKATIISVETTPAGDDPMGELIGGILKIKGPSLPAIAQRVSPRVSLGETQVMMLCSSGKTIAEGWRPDTEPSMEDQDVTLLLIADNAIRGWRYFLVLAQVGDSTSLFERVGLMSTVGDNNLDWEEREFTIV